MNVVSVFERTARRFGDRVFLIDRDQRVTYSEADRRANAAALDLKQRGIEAGDTVGVCSGDRVELWITVLGIWKAGALPGLVDSRTPDGSLAYFVNDIGAKFFVASSDQANRLSSVGVPDLEDIATFCLASSGEGLDVHGDGSPLYLSYTSGTTGDPKGAVINSGPVSLATHCIADRIGISKNDVLLATTPASSSFQLVAAFLPAIHRGAALVLAAGLDIAPLVELGATHSSTILISYPLTLSDYVNHQTGQGSPLRAAMSGGSPLPPRLKADFRDQLGIPLLESYGQSEMGGFMALGSPGDDEERAFAGYVGRSLPDRLAYVGDSDGVELPAGEFGEVLVDDGYFSHYRNKPRRPRQPPQVAYSTRVTSESRMPTGI